MNKKLASHHKHIDNGGVSVDISVDEYKNIAVKFNTSYFGYPNITSTVNGSVQLGSEWLRKMSELFLEAAIAYEKLPKVDECD